MSDEGEKLDIKILQRKMKKSDILRDNACFSGVITINFMYNVLFPIGFL